MSTVLIIDDEPGIRSVLSDILKDENYDVRTANDGFEGLSLMKTEEIDLVILDIWLPNMGGIDVLKQLKQDYSDIEVIVISGHANIDLAVKAVKLGAFDFLEKPLSLDKIITLVRNALHLESLKRENKNLKTSIFIEDRMIGSSPSMQRVRELIAQSAKSDAKVLITGENGTGKELVAREIHTAGARSDKPFVEVNCAAIPDTLIESELFGHEKGAFTSAVSMRKGKFELADKGTLFLDEIADMSPSAQAKVLRAIQEMRFERIGSEETIDVDVRILAATNKNIQEEIAAGRFREDLFFRLNVVPIDVPSLKERIEDLPELLEYFLEKYKHEGDESPKTVSPEGLRILERYLWPGNIRELKNFAERVTIMTEESEISAETVQHFLGEKNNSLDAGELQEFHDLKLNEAKDLFEVKFLEIKLQEHDYNISQTAQTLGIYPSNLHGKIRKFGIEMKK
jgi:two-component system, NtrC family, nitrogen regulation response regulator NtrX